jgi:thioredoxin reductase (NADPH)
VRAVIQLLLGDGHGDRNDLAADLRRRFGADYEIVAGRDAGVDGPVALVIAGDADVLAAAHRRHPAAKRVLLVDRGDWSAGHPAIAALALGRIDYHLYRPWRPLERNLYGPVTEFLAAWESSRPPSEPAFRIVGEEPSVASHELRDVLTRAGVPYWFHPAGSAEADALLAETGTSSARLPVVVSFDGHVLIQPGYRDLAAELGLPDAPPPGDCDVAIVGAGPAGLAAAVYGASEGLRTVVLEPLVPGGQAGTSSLIRNYLGFPRGLSGDELTNRAVEQAWLFGAHLVVPARVHRLAADGDDRLVWTGDGPPLRARAVVLATGVTWRRLGLESLEALVGAGVFYGAAGAEARAVTGGRAFVVGAGNSAGQAALHLARYAAEVTLVVRRDSLAATMSEYLITEITRRPEIRVLTGTEVCGGGGRDGLDHLELRHRASGTLLTEPASALFVMIGAEPRTDWLAGVVDRDADGFVVTGETLQTSLPGVFAAGDVRAGSVKRVASAAGEGAVAIQAVHRYLG